MTAVAYLYFPTPIRESVPALIEKVLAAGISVSHFGRNDPPPKWNGDVQAMSQLVLEQPEQNKYAFIRDKKQRIDLTLELFYDPRWSHSTLSFSTPTPEYCLSLAKALSKQIDPYLCIQGESGEGKGQAWFVLYERQDCPPKLSNGIQRA